MLVSERVVFGEHVQVIRKLTLGAQVTCLSVILMTWMTGCGFIGYEGITRDAEPGTPGDGGSPGSELAEETVSEGQAPGALGVASPSACTVQCDPGHECIPPASCLPRAWMAFDTTRVVDSRAPNLGEGGEPVALELGYSGSSPVAEWRTDGAYVSNGGFLRSDSEQIALRETLMQADVLTIELSVTPASLEFEGERRLLTLTQPDSPSVAFTVGHGSGGDGCVDAPSCVSGRVRRGAGGDPQGLGQVADAAGLTRVERAHIVFTRDASEMGRIWINGELRATLDMLGSFAEWPDTPLC